MRNTVTNDDVPVEDYRALAEFRYQIRRFLHFSEQVARAANLEPQQHQLLLMIAGLPPGMPATVSTLAERLQIRHHSAVSLIDRLEQRGLVERWRHAADRRQVVVRLTEQGEAILRRCSAQHRAELRTASKELVRALNALMAEDDRSGSPSDPSSNGLPAQTDAQLWSEPS